MPSGNSLFVRDGAFAPLLKSFIEKALEAEMDLHQDKSERSKGNKCNGKGKKAFKTGVGTFDIQTPVDGHSRFESELVRKFQTILADNLSEKIIGFITLMSLVQVQFPPLGKKRLHRNVRPFFMNWVQHIADLFFQ